MKDGYKEDRSLKEMIGLAKQVPDLEGIELVEGWHVSADTLKDVKELVKEAGLVVTVVHPDLWTTKKWAFAMVCDHNPNVHVGIEYKIKEPRVHMHFGTLGKVMLLVNEWLKSLRALIDKIGMKKVQQTIKQEDAIETLALIREAMFGG